jgi:hypothetical protein
MVVVPSEQGFLSLRTQPHRLGLGRGRFALALPRQRSPFALMLFYHKGAGSVQHHFPLSLAPGKPRFSVGTCGQHTTVIL